MSSYTSIVPQRAWGDGNVIAQRIGSKPVTIGDHHIGLEETDDGV